MKLRFPVKNFQRYVDDGVNATTGILTLTIRLQVISNDPDVTIKTDNKK